MVRKVSEITASADERTQTENRTARSEMACGSGSGSRVGFLDPHLFRSETFGFATTNPDWIGTVNAETSQ